MGHHFTPPQEDAKQSERWDFAVSDLKKKWKKKGSIAAARYCFRHDDRDQQLSASWQEKPEWKKNVFVEPIS